jgi:hypothetical protein
MYHYTTADGNAGRGWYNGLFKAEAGIAELEVSGFVSLKSNRTLFAKAKGYQAAFVWPVF